MQEPHNLTDDELYNRRNAARATLDEWEEQGYLSNDTEDEIEMDVRNDLLFAETELLRRRRLQ